MRIILDGMGGDNAPMEIVKGAVQAAKEIDHEIYIVGKEDLINEELSCVCSLCPLDDSVCAFCAVDCN